MVLIINISTNQNSYILLCNYKCLLIFYCSILIAYSIAPEKPLTGYLALNEKLCGVSKHYVNKLKGPEGLLNHNNTLYTSIHYGHVLKLIDGQTIPVVKFGKECGI